MTALWSVMGDIITGEPKQQVRSLIFGATRTIRSRLLEAAELITAKEAERRVLILENPGLRGQSRATTSLYAGVQLVMPGEVAPAHRHSQAALRLLLGSRWRHHERRR